jgi:purine-binding chemotaxis protein CheW
MEKTMKLVIFQVADQRFAIPLFSIERVVAVVEVSPLAKSPDFILGTINFEGEFLPVINIRNVFKLPGKEIDLDDQLMITQTSSLKIALWIDKTIEVVELFIDEIEKSGKIMLETNHVKGIFKFEDGMVLLQDLDQLLTIEQITLLQAALAKAKMNEFKILGKSKPGLA